MYGECRLNGTLPEGTWSFQFDDIDDGAGGVNTTDRISLRNLNALKDLGDVWTGDATKTAKSDTYMNRPEIACFAVCREQFKDNCTLFAFDGIQEQTCVLC